MSADVQWLVVRNNSCFLRKKNKAYFSAEPNNLKNLNSFRFSGLVRDKTLGIEAGQDNKGVVVVKKKNHNARRPNRVYERAPLKHGARRTLMKISKMVKKDNYRKDLRMAAMRRASAIMASQKPRKLSRRSRLQKKKE
ncbi:unnamed protein product [Dimorphilus gyrociliatus]|uniref:Large ribosomal subunit protein eL28 n=1 Tax=Dimorphilus gyrociliatus TaxID=2664684 RepID=A0A7I8W394_9ANNE|nr:unnamed protein product [Dimorphilus gyrociliatus]